MNRLSKPLAAALFCFTLPLINACSTATPSPSADPQVNISASTDLNDAASIARRLAVRYGTNQVLVAFDLDNTLLAMRTAVGSDQWYDWQRSLQEADACDSRLVSNRLAAQGALFHVGSMRPTQTDAATVVAALQEEGFTTMIVTARGQDFRLPTFRELRRADLSFRDSAPGPRGGQSKAYTPNGAKRPVRYEDGVYMLAGQHKGNLLLSLYRESLNLPLPQAVVFADDKRKNIDAMAEALRRSGVHGELFHYQREAIDQFDTDQAAAAWERLEPALNAIESIMGPVNYDLPSNTENPACSMQRN